MNNPWCDLLGIASSDIDDIVGNAVPNPKGGKRTKVPPDELAKYVKKMRSQFPQLSEQTVNDIYEQAVSKYEDRFRAVDAIKAEIGRGVGQAAFDQKPAWKKAVQVVGNVMNAPRSMMTPLDIPVMRQGGIMSISHPVMAVKNIRETLKAMRDEEVAQAIDASIRADPNFDLLQEHDMYHSPLERNARPESKEEAYSNTLAEKIPWYGQKVIRMSERGYSTYLNLMRRDVANRRIARFVEDHGRMPNGAELDVLSKYVNVISGRGSLGALEKVAPELNQLFFSPRWVASRLQFLTSRLADTIPGAARALLDNQKKTVGGSMQTATGTVSAKIQPRIQVKMQEGDAMRLQIAREYARYVIGVSTILGSLKAAKEMAPGTKEEKDKQMEIFGGGDMKSTNWGKVRIGNTHFDLMSGLAQQMVLADRLLTQSTYQGGKLVKLGQRAPGSPTKAPTSLDLIGTFGRSKLAPFPSVIASMGANEDVPAYRKAPDWEGPQLGVDVTGNPVTLFSAVEGLTTPMIVRDVREAARLDGVPMAFATAIASALSTSVSSYQSGKPKKK